MADDIQDEDLTDEDALDNDLYVNGGSFMKETSNLFNVENDEVQYMHKKLRKKLLKQYRQAEILALREARNNIRNIRVQTGDPWEQIELVDELAKIALKTGKRDVWYHMSQFIDRKISVAERERDKGRQRIYRTLRDLTDPVRTAVLQAYKNFRKFYNMGPLSEEDSMNLMYLEFDIHIYSEMDIIVSSEMGIPGESLRYLSAWRKNLGFPNVQIPDPITGSQGCPWQLDLPLDLALVGDRELVNSYDFDEKWRESTPFVWDNNFAQLYVQSKPGKLFKFRFPIPDIFNKS